MKPLIRRNARSLARLSITIIAGLTLSSCVAPSTERSEPPTWETVTTRGAPSARHEAAFVAHRGKLYLIGGRREQPVDVFDSVTGQWTRKTEAPLELHHVQAVSHGDAIYLIGAMTGGYPDETPLDRVLKYLPDDDRFEWGVTIPENRRRGAAGVAVYRDRIYIVGGITHGHRRGSRAWLDEFDPATGQWRVLPDAPHARDHVQAAVAGDRLYAFAGRRTSLDTDEVLELTEDDGDVFDLAQGRWLPASDARKLPTQRAGNMAIGWDDLVIVAGGESALQVPAHGEVEVFDTKGQRWTRWPDLGRGRHGTGFARIGDVLYTAAGCGNRGGEPELTSLERLRLPPPKP